MPAAQLSRLQAQIKSIATQFVHPKIFVRNLLKLMEMYSDKNIQASTYTKMEVLIPSYRLPQVVIQQIESQLVNLVDLHPTTSIEVIDGLWQKSYFEPRYLAAVMIGNLPADFADFTLSRLENWVNPKEEKKIVQTLLKISSQQIRHQVFHKWVALIRSWLNHPDEEYQQIGLRAMKINIDDPRLEEIPLFYELIEPIILNMSLALQKDLLQTFSSLAHQFPKESISFLKSILEKTESTMVHRFIRRCLPFFDDELQNILLRQL
jgi:hypothetical protein